MSQDLQMSAQAMFYSNLKGLPLFKRGKVRDVYKPGDEHLLIVACDRISAFDHVLPTPIPGKGKILTQISNFFFAKTAHIVPNHIVDPNPGPQWYPEANWYSPELDGRTVLVRATQPLAIEAIVRGYLSGSGWKEYRETGTICGIPLPAGLRESERLPQPIFTPSTKASSGHDQNITFMQAAAIIGPDLTEEVRELSLRLYDFAARYAEERGIIIADTKFEFGLAKEGELFLIDEIFTPDSSRFWPAETYEPGKPQASFDKQYVRDYLESIAWNKEPPAPELPPEVVAKTKEKYEEALRRLTA